MILKNCSSRWARSSACEEVKEIQKTSLLTGKDRKPGTSDRIRNQSVITVQRKWLAKKVMVVTNLKPAKLAGVLSEGMILCAEDAEGNLSLMVPEKKMPAGAEIC